MRRPVRHFVWLVMFAVGFCGVAALRVVAQMRFFGNLQGAFAAARRYRMAAGIANALDEAVGTIDRTALEFLRHCSTSILSTSSRNNLDVDSSLRGYCGSATRACVTDTS